MLSAAVENFRTRVLMALQTTASAADDYLLPTGGARSAIVRAIVTMGNAADLVLSLKTADDAAGTNAAAIAENVPIYVNGVAQTAAKTNTVSDSSGNFVVDFVVDLSLVPAGKYLGLAYGNSDVANLMTALLIEDVAYKPTAAA